ncbi:hypothetical protein PTTG_28121 [Puccinia triticina 1-1 BBBD Race 1]|uniref:Uncharacterized protein n=2 Tax=Puccinia triticina TaxID=208348 RepID=A0A180GF93_PUCT1|nr:uncharacterized protein PtA15_4A553 [Puccinia triticina]OAV91002.1 hypothetical protein PTTG_28121 [Puccinia triticina 1-1 BBBD Race 1]WAQ84102.1 hypothetical protein PtA15_4A553 [Puccinia triticina]WAR54933.1 hypothetical protein PtB15_4B551 [Puccinia triticina]
MIDTPPPADHLTSQSVKTSQPSLLQNDKMWSPVPSGVNPFAYLMERSASKGSAPMSGLTKILLLIFFIIHLLIAIFCLVILVLPCFRGTIRSHWLFRKLYIRDHSFAGNVSRAPLYWVNGGIVMTASQLMGSAATEAYIVLQFLIAHSAQYALHAQVEPALAMMCVCEMLTYWSQMHCFVVAIYYNHKAMTHDVRRWAPSPTFVNFLFLGFPLVLVVATLPPVIGLSIIHRQLTVRVIQTIETLGQSSFIWERMRVSTSDEEKKQLTIELTRLVSRAKDLGDSVGIRIERLRVCFYSFLWDMLAQLCITILLFIIVFSIFLRKVQRKEVQSGHESSKSGTFRRCRWFKLKNPTSTSEVKLRSSPNTGHEESSSSNRGTLNRQFAYLILRASFIVIAIATSITLCLLGIIRTRDGSGQTPYWRAVMTWLPPLAGTWSAFPIAWQCWGLYNDELNGTLRNSATSNDSPSAGQTIDKSEIPPKRWECELEEIEIRVFPMRSSPRHEP